MEFAASLNRSEEETPLKSLQRLNLEYVRSVEQRDVAMRVLTGDPDDEGQVSLDQKPFRTLVSGFPATEERALLGLRENRHPSESAEVKGERVL